MLEITATLRILFGVPVAGVALFATGLALATLGSLAYELMSRTWVLTLRDIAAVLTSLAVMIGFGVALGLIAALALRGL
jgi:ABC-type proline/glycine betaine transport system permease subunit